MKPFLHEYTFISVLQNQNDESHEMLIDAQKPLLEKIDNVSTEKKNKRSREKKY